MIPYKEYAACREAGRRASTVSKSTSGEKEDWDEEPPLPPQETPPGAGSMAWSQEDEWKQMVNQDPCSGSEAGDSGHGTMTATGEDEFINNIKELVGAVGELMRVSPLSTSQMLNGEMTTHCLCLATIMS